MTAPAAPNTASRRFQPVTFAAFGGIYLAITVAWLFATQANQLIFDDKFAQAMSTFGEFWAIVAAPLWFFAVMTQTTRFRARIIVLAIGAVVLFPFPLFFGVPPQ